MKLLTFCKQGAKFYLICLAVYVVIFAIVSLLFMRTHLRHLCLAFQSQPITEYTIKGTDYDVEKHWEQDENSTDKREKLKYEYTYYLSLGYKDAVYPVEVRKGLYENVKEQHLTSFAGAKSAPTFCYDEAKDEVFLKGYFPMKFYYFMGTALLLFFIAFVYMPYQSYKSFEIPKEKEK